jgi:hypothetical protein
VIDQQQLAPEVLVAVGERPGHRGSQLAVEALPFRVGGSGGGEQLIDGVQVVGLGDLRGHGQISE